MSVFFQFLLILNALFFLFYGLQSLNSRRMIAEFRRFGLTETQRKITGALQLFGVAGLLTGLYIPFVGLLSAAGFTVMMFVAFVVRMRIKDSVNPHYSPRNFLAGKAKLKTQRKGT